jgi:dihydroxyacetone kinase-like protein
MGHLTLRNVVELFGRLAAAFEQNRDRLNELDAAIGDGDHGLSMARGFSAVAAALREKAPATISDALTQGGMQFNEVSGSTIGILMFSAMREAGKTAAGKETLEAEALEAAARAAEEGAEATRGLDSKIGRARWFSERSRGALDPGAVSGAIIVRNVVDYVREGEVK